MKEISISFDNVSKKYGKHTGIMDAFSLFFKIGDKTQFFALSDLNLKLGQGDTLGIVGKNGSGKSTLLKLLANITKPSHGKILRDGKIGALIEIGAGFQPDLTGRENIFLYGAILGMSRREIREKFEKIANFSEIGQFLDTPVKFYSTGMYMRLGFAVAIHTDPDILLIDEVFAVGDASFQKKCITRIEQMKADKKIIIIVSHDTKILEHMKYCLWLENGNQKMFGPSKEVLMEYRASIFNHKLESYKLFENKIDKDIAITKITMLSEDNNPAAHFKPNTLIQFDIAYHSNKSIKNAVFGLAIFREGDYLFGSKIAFENIKCGANKLRLSIPNNPFLHGNYDLSVGVCQNDMWYNSLDYHRDVLRFHIIETKETQKYDGWINPPHYWK